jgi:hypothetical protein
MGFVLDQRQAGQIVEIIEGGADHLLCNASSR